MIEMRQKYSTVAFGLLSGRAAPKVAAFRAAVCSLLESKPDPLIY